MATMRVSGMRVPTDKAPLTGRSLGATLCETWSVAHAGHVNVPSGYHSSPHVWHK